MQQNSLKIDKQVYANILFEDQYLIKSGGERVTAYHFGAGHTFGDAMYHFEKKTMWFTWEI